MSFPPPRPYRQLTRCWAQLDIRSVLHRNNIRSETKGEKIKRITKAIFEVFTAALLKTLLLGFDFPTALLRFDAVSLRVYFPAELNIHLL